MSPIIQSKEIYMYIRIIYFYLRLVYPSLFYPGYPGLIYLGFIYPGLINLPLLICPSL